MPESRLQKTREAYPVCERCHRRHLTACHGLIPKYVKAAAQKLAEEANRRAVATIYASIYGEAKGAD